jgi:TRAP-type uncharacterized transport system fused permease subunit
LGDQPFVPEVAQWKGVSFSKAMAHQWLSNEGVFGVALGASTSFVFLFVLFVALLGKAGAGNYFLKAPLALLGHLRGGPAQAAVLSSALTSLMSGSTFTNVAGRGALTVPLMKRVGFPAEKAAAVEVAASTTGQLTPPIMGAAAFMMVEYVGISYIDVIKHAFLPAVISCVALVYIVHLEASKADMTGLPRRTVRPAVDVLLSFVLTIFGLIILSGAVYYGLGQVKAAYGDMAPAIVVLCVLVAYLGLLWAATRFPELLVDDPNSAAVELPEPGPTIISGLYFLLPVVVLLWCLMVERFSPGSAVFWAIVFTMFIVATQRPLQALFRGKGHVREAVTQGFRELLDGLVSGARNMIGIGVAMAAAGIIVSTVSLTNMDQAVAGLVELASAGNLMPMLIIAAIISLVLGMGQPTTASYIVVATVVAPVIVALGAQDGFIVPLIAVHMFVFYFGILANAAPLLGRATFAAAAIAHGDPIKTGLQGFTYDIRTAILPFMFIFNTDLLLIDVSLWQAVLIFVVATAAMLAFAAATQGFFIVRSRIWETLVLLVVAFTLFRPGFWLDRVQPPFESVSPARLTEVTSGAPADSELRLKVEGEDLTTGAMVSKTILLPLGPAGDGAARLAESAGIEIREEDGRILIDNVTFGSPAGQAKLAFDWEITMVQLPAPRLPKEIFLIPAFGLLILIYYLQRRRRPEP